MKKILSLLVLVAVFASCEEDIKFNNPAVQALKDNVKWKAREFSAIKTGNSVIITAKTDIDTVTITLNAPAPNSVHDLGVNNLNSAAYDLSVDGITESYATGTIGNGKVVIMDVKDNNIDGTAGKGFISGSFYFNAYTSDKSEVVNFQEGVFYKVPITVKQ
ncbi:DUF6252 family protein [Flavobacterium hauense]